MKKILQRGLLALACLASFWAATVSAEPLRCSAFLRYRDGGWRSFYEADLLGPDGPVHVRAGEKLSASAPSAKGDIARALDELCEDTE